VYQFQVAPVPSEPPVIESVVAPFGQILLTLGDALVAATDEVFVTFTVTETQPELPQVPSARTQYVVVTAGDTARDVPDPTDVPPQLPVYHCQVAPVPRVPPVMESVVAPPAQVGFTLADALVAATETVFETVTGAETQPVLPQVPSART
jgi:hypothetical protein